MSVFDEHNSTYAFLNLFNPWKSSLMLEARPTQTLAFMLLVAIEYNPSNLIQVNNLALLGCIRLIIR